MNRTRTALASLALALALAATPAGAQDPTTIEDLKVQLRQAMETLTQQQAAIEALQKKLAEVEAKTQAVPPAAPAPSPGPEMRKAVQEEVAKATPNLGNLAGLKVGGQIFYSYQDGDAYSADSPSEDKTDAYGRFVLKRGYLDVQKEITPWLRARVMPEITQDSTGDYKLRMKYIYAGFGWKGNRFVNAPYLEAGLVRTPWFDFEEGINIYRMQDNMFLERVGLVGTTDAGLLFGGDLGAPLIKSYQDQVSSKYAGRWGSFQLGLYNGGGYAAAEKNVNKSVMGRVTFRPLPDALPGLQFTVFGLTGRGNVTPANATKDPFKGREIYPAWSLLNGMISYQHAYFTLTGQYVTAKGNAAGNRYYTASDYVPGEVDPADVFEPRSQKGYSFFAEIKFPSNKRWSWMGRMDYFDPDTKGILVLQNNRDVTRRYITGFAYRLFKDDMILVDYDLLKHSKTYRPGTFLPDEDRFQVTLQVKF